MLYPYPTRPPCRGRRVALAAGGSILAVVLVARPLPSEEPVASAMDRETRYARALVEYFERMGEPEPFRVRRGAAFEGHRAEVRRKLLASVGLSPLPERVPLEVRETPALEHPWCTVRRVYWQVWPGVWSNGLLYLPRERKETSAPAILSPHGHWHQGNAHAVVQSRCLVFAKLGYVVLSPEQQHYEDLALGISHQTVGVWSNLRALDLLESRAAVDRERIGVCGASGGGLQTQMVVALDSRPRAAAIVGMTCDFREILFPHASHCACNHYPGVMGFTDGPEISALGLPVPVLYLTMDDWTRTFEAASFPRIRELYEANGAAGRAACRYEPTAHEYGRSKRESTYRWMERWLRGVEPDPGVHLEPDRVETFPPERLAALRLDLDGANAFERVSALVERTRCETAPRLGGRDDWIAWRDGMAAALRGLLGEPFALPRRGRAPEPVRSTEDGDLRVERLDIPGEGGVRVPTIVLRPRAATGSLPVIAILDGRGKDAALRDAGEGGAASLARRGALVVLPDVRLVGELSPEALAGEVGLELAGFQPASPLGKPADAAGRARQLRTAWERNSIVWGRPIAAMAAEDLRTVLDALAARSDADLKSVRAISRGPGECAAAVLFAALLDTRIGAIDIDLEGRSFRRGELALVPSILLRGDVLRWAGALADRTVTLRNVRPDLPDRDWLAGAFRVVGNGGGLEIR